MLSKGVVKNLYLFIIFLSGLTSLIYQILWIREFSLYFGVHVYSLSTVLAAFMGGLALGSYLFGRIADRFPGKAGLIFFGIQLCIGVFAIVFSPFLSFLSDIFTSISQTFQFSPALANLIRPLFGFLLLIIPTTLMGGVIPTASKIFIENINETGKKVSLIYFINNAGAVAGCFLAGFILVATFGTQTTFFIAASINFVAGLSGIFLFQSSGSAKSARIIPISPTPSEEENHVKYPQKMVKTALWVFALEGFTTLAYQVFWTRLMLEFSFEKTIYFTTVIIMSFIIGLTLGGYTYHLIEKRIKNLYLFLGKIQVLAGISSLLLFIVFNKLAPQMVLGRMDIVNWQQLALREYSFVMVLLFIPTFFTGMTFPLVSRIYASRMDSLGTKVGITGMLDTVGSIAGSLVAGFILLPLLGIYFSFMLVVLINLLLGLVIFNSYKALKGKLIYKTMPSILFFAILFFPVSEYFRLQDSFYRGDRVVFRKEGVAATVRVNDQPNGHLALVINGAKTAFTNDDDLRVHKMLAYLPYVYNPEAKDAYVIGFGMGVTSSSLARLPLQSVTAADICPELLLSAPHFAPFNHRIWEKDNFRFIAEDGRSYLLRSDQKFDIITSNAIHARLNSTLYTREFYQLTSKKINPGGVVAQWVPTNWLTYDEFTSLIKAFTDVFETAHMWFVTRGHVVLVGSNDHLPIRYENIESLYRNNSARVDLSIAGANIPQRFAANLIFGGNDLHRYTIGSPVNTDDLPIPEFSRETNLKPNTRVLFDLASHESGFKKNIIFPNLHDSILQPFIFDVIEAENNLLRHELMNFVRLFGNKERYKQRKYLSKSNYMEILLKSSWQFRQAGSNSWYPAQIPGSVHTDLLKNNQIEDPFIRFNEDKVQWIEEKDWEYRTTFMVDEEILTHDVVRLYFKGLDTYASVFLNEELLLETDNMFVGEKVNCKEKLRLGENTLRIYFDSPVRRGMERLKAFGHALPATNEQAPEDQRTNVFTRKAPFHYGWDWGPRLVTSGIWRPIEIQAWSKAKIEDLYVVTRSVSDKIAELDAELELLAKHPTKGKVSLMVNGRDLGIRKEVDLKPGINKVSFEFSLEDPRLWWPNGLGESYQYNFTFNLESDDEILHQYELDYGVRTVSLVQEPDATGKSFYFKVNGIPVFMKGANIIPSETITPAVTEETYRKLIDNATAANMNMLRVWGGAIYEEDLFYKLCNENGLLVWQDFMFACALQPGNEEHLENIRREAEYNVKRLRNNASIALWCGNNENLMAWHKWGWQDLFDQEMRDYLWRTYEKIFYEILPETVNALDPKNSYWASSPSTWDNKVADRKSGDEHDWTIWFGHQPFEAFWENAPRFVSEWGLQAFPEMATINGFSLPEDHKWDSKLMRHRQRSDMSWFEPGFDGNDNIRKYMEMYYKIPEDFSEFVYVSQLLQAKGYRTAIEAHRTNMPVCMGSLYWQLNDCWPTISWATLDYHYRWKAAHYAVKKAFEPVIITSSVADGIVRFYAVSDLLSSFDATLEVTLMDFSGNVLFKQSWDARIAANNSTALLTKNFMAYLNDMGSESMVLSIRLLNKDVVIAQNLQYFSHPKDLKLLPAKINYSIKDEDNNTYYLEIESNKLVKGLYISFDDPDVFLTDNYFDLLPGETRMIKISTEIKKDIGKPMFTYLNR